MTATSTETEVEKPQDVDQTTNAMETPKEPPKHSLEKTLSAPADPTQPLDDEVEYPSGLKVVLIIASLCLSVFLVALDQTIIAPALGAITSQFESVADIGWYGAAYLLTATALQPSYGAIYRAFSVKYTFLVAVVIFEIGSLVTAVAPTSNAFIVGRALAGLGTGGTFSGGVVILAYTLPLAKRPAAFGLVGGMWGLASVAGPLLGGAFTQNLTWRWCFYINLPIGGLAIGVILLFLQIKRKNNPDNLPLLKRILELDILGAAILVPAVVCLLLALQWGGAKYPWNNSRIIGLFVGFGLMAAVFIGIQLWKQDKGTLPPRLFKKKDILCALMFAFFFGGAFFPLVYYLSIYFQAIQGDSAVQAGIKLLPLLLATVISSVLTGIGTTVTGYYNPYVLPCMALFAIGSGLLTTFTTTSPLRIWFSYQVIAGLGVGPGFQIGVLVVQNILPMDQVPVGTACVQFFQSLGGSIFIAVAQSLFENGIISGIEQNAPQVNAQEFINVGASQVLGILQQIGNPAVTDAVLNAYLQGLRHTFFISVACAAAAFVFALCLSWKPIKKPEDKKDAEAKPAKLEQEEVSSGADAAGEVSDTRE